MKKEFNIGIVSKSLAVIIVLSMMLSTLVGCGSSTSKKETETGNAIALSSGEKVEDSVSEVGSFSNKDITVSNKEADYYEGVAPDAAFLMKKDGKNYFCDYLGKPVLECEEALPLANNIYTFAKKIDKENPKLGLVNDKGKVLLDCEASEFEVISDRYIVVCMNKDSDSESKKVFDLESNRFVPNIEITKSDLNDDTEMRDVEFVANGDDIIEDANVTMHGETECDQGDGDYIDDGFKTKVYTPEGRVILESEQDRHNLTWGVECYKLEKKNEEIIYDNEGKEIRRGEKIGIVEADETDQPLMYEFEGDDAVYYDGKGKKVLENIKSQGYSIDSVFDGVVCATKLGESDGKYGLLTSDGKEIVPPKSKGGFLHRNSTWVDGKKLYSKNGLICSSLPKEDKFEDFDIYYQKDKSGEQVLLLDGSNKLLSYKSIQALKKGLAKVQKGNKYGVINVYSGKTVLDARYDKIEYCNGYLYALSGDTWKVFELK